MTSKRAIISAAAVLACGAAGVAAWWFMATRLPAPTVLLQMTGAERAAAIDSLREAEEPAAGPDAGPALRDAIDAMQHVLDGPNRLATVPYFDLELSSLPLQAGAPELAARQVLASAHVFERLQAIDGAGWVSVQDSGAVGPVGGPTDDATAARHLVRVLALEMKVAATSGDGDSLAASFERALLASRAYALRLEALPWLVAVGMRATALHAVIDLAAAGMIDADEAARLMDVLDRDRGMPGAEAALRAVAVRECSPDSMHARLYPADLRRAAPRIEAVRDELIALIGTPTHRLPPPPEESDILEDRFPGAGFLPEQVRPAERLDLADSYKASALHVLTTANMTLQLERSCRVALALERHRGAHGSYPQSLDALGLPAEMLTSPVTGKQMALHMLEAPDEHGRRYLLDWGTEPRPEPDPDR